MSRIYYLMTDYNCHYLYSMIGNNFHYLNLWQIITVIVYILWQRISDIINIVWQILNVIIYHLWHLLTIIISPTMTLINCQEKVFDDSFFLDSNVIIIFSVPIFYSISVFLVALALHGQIQSQSTIQHTHIKRNGERFNIYTLIYV